MGKIKSAWEIALERTENIVIDAEKIRHNEATDKIRRIAGAYLLEEVEDREKLQEDLSKFSLEDIKNALGKTILNGLTLPSEEVTDNRFERLEVLLTIATKENENQSNELFEQIANLLKQYPMHRKQLLEQMKAQFEPMLREKEAQMKEQYGQEVHLSLETDKEFAQVARQNLDKLEMQYQQTLDGAKAQLKEFL